MKLYTDKTETTSNRSIQYSKPKQTLSLGKDFTRSQERLGYKLHHYYNILASVSHFENVSNLDQKSWFLTVRIPDGTYHQASKQIYLGLNRIRSGKSFRNDPYRPALIIHPDVAGTRQNSLVDDCHHFHGLLILAQNDFADIGVDGIFQRELIENQIRLISLDPERMYRPLKPELLPYKIDKSLSYVVDYCGKFEKKTGNQAFGKFFEGTVLPYEMDLGGKKKSANKKAQRRARLDELINIFLRTPDQLFSQAYIDHFGEELEQICQFGLREQKRQPQHA